MAVKLRLMRMGKKKQPTYRVVAADARSPRNGRFIEIIGTYQPRLDPSVINIDNEKALKWLLVVGSIHRMLLSGMCPPPLPRRAGPPPATSVCSVAAGRSLSSDPNMRLNQSESGPPAGTSTPRRKGKARSGRLGGPSACRSMASATTSW